MSCVSPAKLLFKDRHAQANELVGSIHTHTSKIQPPNGGSQACAAAGKHVFCEKPIATGLAETIEAINTCREANVKLMTALQVGL